MGTVEALSVWPVAQAHGREQRSRRYLPESSAHPGKMLPALAREAIRRFTGPEDFVLDPMCGIGTTLVEAIHLGRRAYGLELEPRWAEIAEANVEQAEESADGEGYAFVEQADARNITDVLEGFEQAFTLILTSPPYGPSTHGHVRKHPDHVEKLNTYYSNNPNNLAHLPTRAHRRNRRPDFDSVLTEILVGCARMLDPDEGRLVLTVRPYRQHGALVDLPGRLIKLAAQAGLEFASREVALLCGLRDSELVPRASFFQLHHQRAGKIERMLLIAHEDVLVFTAAKNPGRRRG